MEITKELIYEQFAKLKTKDEKVKYLIDLKEDKQKSPHVFRNIKISIKQFNNLIRGCSSVVPVSAMKREIAECEEREKGVEMLKKKD